MNYYHKTRFLLILTNFLRFLSFYIAYKYHLKLYQFIIIMLIISITILFENINCEYILVL